MSTGRCRVAWSAALLLAGAGAASAGEEGVRANHGDKIRATLTAGDEDAYSVRVSEGGRWTFRVRADRRPTLRPTLRAFDAAGAPIDLTPFLAGAGTGTVTARNVPVAPGGTSRLRLVVAGTDGAPGGYTVTCSSTPQKKPRRSAVPLDGNAFEFAFDAEEGAQVDATFTLRGAVPQGDVWLVQGDRMERVAAKVRRGRRPTVTIRRRAIDLGSGHYRLLVAVEDPAAEPSAEVLFRIGWPREKPRRATLPPEASVAAVTPSAVRQGALGTDVLLKGTNLPTSGATVEISGTGVVLRSATSADATQTALLVAVQNDAPYGPRDVTIRPDPRFGEPLVVRDAFAVWAPVPALEGATVSRIREEETVASFEATGRDFRAGGRLSTPRKGVVFGTPVLLSSSRVRATVTALLGADLGPHDLLWTQPEAGGGESAGLAAALTVDAAVPRPTAASPAVVQGAGPTDVRITGSRFRPGGTLSLSGSGVTISEFAWVSETEIRATLAADADASFLPRDVTWTQAASLGGAAGTAQAALAVHAPDPTLTSVSPSTFTQGDAPVEVVVRGTAFREGGTLSLGPLVQVTDVTLVAEDEIRCTAVVDENAAPSPDVSADVVFTQPSAGGGASATLAAGVTVKWGALEVLTVSPAELLLGQTTAVTLTGRGFVPGISVSMSGSDASIATVQRLSYTRLVANVSVPSNAAMGTRDVTLTLPASAGGGSLTSPALLRVGYPAPTISTVAPGSADQTAAGTLTVTGTGFRAGGSLSVSGAGVSLTEVTVVSPTSLTASYAVDQNALPSFRNVTFQHVAAAGGASATKTSAFQVKAFGPTFHGISPSAWGVGQSRFLVAIDGANFDAAAAVSVSGTGITVHSTQRLSSSEIRMVVSTDPSALVGARSLTITPGNGPGPTKTFSDVLFLVPGDPTVTSFAPGTIAAGASGQSVTVRGTNFRQGDTLAVSGSGITVSSVSVVDATTLTAALSVGSSAATGPRDVTVAHSSSEGGRPATLAAAFRVVKAAPTITSVSPSALGRTGSGGPTREVPITITGTDFGTGASVSVSKSGGSGLSLVSGSVVVDSATRIAARVSIGGTATTGLWDVKVTNPGGSDSGSSGASALDVKSETTLCVDAVEPPSGLAFGGERVAIRGSGFSATDVVDFGTVRALRILYADRNTIVATVPRPTTSASLSAPAVRDVKVTTSGGSSATLTGGYTYLADPEIRVLASFPRFNATNLPASLRSVALLLSAPLDASTASGATWYESGGSYVSGATSGAGPGQRWLVVSRTGTSNLPTSSGGRYIVIASAAKSFTGEPLRLQSYSGDWDGDFTVSTSASDTAAPTLTSITPANNATSQDLVTAVTLVFSEPVDPLTITSTNVRLSRGANTVASSLQLLSDCATVRVVPDALLAASTTYTVSVSSGVKDLYGNAMTSLTRTFTTGTSTDTTAPVVESIRFDDLPPDMDGSGNYVNASGSSVSYDSYLARDGWSVVVTYRDDGAGIDPSAFSAKCSAAVGSSSANAELAGNFAVDPVRASWTVPSTGVTAGDDVTLTFSVKDRAGNTSSSSTATVDVVGRDSTATFGGDHDPFDAREVWLLRVDLDAYTPTLVTSGSPTKVGLTTVRTSNGVLDADEDLVLFGFGTNSMTAAAQTTVNGTRRGTNDIVKALVLARMRELARARFGIAEDGTPLPGSADVEILLPGEQGSLSSAPTFSTSASSSSSNAYSEISLGGTDGAQSSANSHTALGRAWYDARNRYREADLNYGTSTYGLGVFLGSKLMYVANADPIRKLVKQLGGSPVGENASDDDVLADTFDRSSSTDATKNARFDLIHDAVETIALECSGTLAHEIGHSVGLVADGGPKTGLFGSAHYLNTFTTASSALPNTSNHVDLKSGSIMGFGDDQAVGSRFNRYDGLQLGYLLGRNCYDEGK